MIATFCLRLALGMLGTLVLLPARQMHPRFFRTHFLTVLGLCIVAFGMGWSTHFGVPMLAACVFGFLGAVAWIFERPPIGWTLVAVTGAAIFVALWCFDPPLAGATLRPHQPGEGYDHSILDTVIPLTPRSGRVADDLTAAALLGSAMTAMLVGHSYLISPGLSIQPLMRQLYALGIAILLRAAVAGAALWFWTADHELTNLNDETVLWLPVRWLVGLAGPLGFGWLAYRTAKIRSTQSATGILYVVVILTFLGELTSLLLMRETGLPL
jgi:hypothetical protein